MRSILVTVGCLLFSAVLFAQNDRGTITGEVKDQGGAVVPGAAVVAGETMTTVAVAGSLE